MTALNVNKSSQKINTTSILLHCYIDVLGYKLRKWALRNSLIRRFYDL